MIQYLLNTTAIWLLSLIIFDLFLRKESFHGYNRMYLLGSFILGLLLPLWSWQEDSAMYITSLGQPVEQAGIVKQNIIDAAGTHSFPVTWESSLLIVYGIGVLVMTVLLLKEVFLISRLYKKGTHSKDGVWTVIETGKDHSPFSAFRFVFISSKANYTPEQLAIILSHEEQHGHQLHFIDLLAMQLFKIIFWFHPLVYIYYSRLIIVHEYQADKAVVTPPAAYGNFLIEQSLLGNAPVLSHSFNHSPVKKRILMLTRKKANAKSKMFLALPLLLISFLCFTKNAFSDGKRVKEGNKITYNGNVFELNSTTNDTIMLEDPVTGEWIMKIAQREPIPVKLNGDTIYQSYALKNMIGKGLEVVGSKTPLSASGMRLYLLDNLKEDLKKMDDGTYWLGISNVVVNKEGSVVYFDYSGLQTKSPMIQNTSTGSDIDLAMQDKVGKKIAKLIKDMPRHSPAIYKGKGVNSMIEDAEFWNTFEVKNGKVVSL